MIADEARRRQFDGVIVGIFTKQKCAKSTAFFMATAVIGSGA